MNGVCVKAEKISKSFFVIKRKRTFFKVLKALVNKERLREEYSVLRDISFEVKNGERLAIVGKNGSGKTTLLRLITGIYDMTSGNLQINREPRALFCFWIGLWGHLSVIDNIYSFGAIYGMGRNYLKERVSKIIETAQLYDLRFVPLKELSAGQMRRLSLSIFFQVPDDFLIFDESLAFLDQGFIQKCDEYFKELSSAGKTVITTSHDNSFLKKYCTTAIWLDEGHIRMSGSAEKVINEYENSFR